MKLRRSSTLLRLLALAALATLLAGCSPAGSTRDAHKVMAVETFLADVTQNVAGDRFRVDSLIPIGLDPHAFEPTPRDAAAIADSSVLVLNGAGFETWLQPILQSAGGQRQVIVASAGLVPRQPRPGELAAGEEEHSGDPHFWLDPLSVVRYVENIRDGLAQVDPDGRDVYTKNAAAYIQQLKDLDGWIRKQVAQIPPQNRLLVTNHESFGYFADRYGFTIIGTILPSSSTSAAPSARQIAELVQKIQSSGVKAIFLETGTNPQLADQIARETGVKVITGLYTHSITAPRGEAPTYLDMMRYNTNAIVNALK